METQLTLLIAMLCAAFAFTLSASAGLGGSLILVPALALLLGSKQGIAVAAVLLGCNNIAKIVAYRRTIPWSATIGVMVLTAIGSAIGAKLLVAAPELWVSIAIVISFGAAFLMEQMHIDRIRRPLAPLLAFCSGATSGFSGTSGPLKGVALRSLQLDRFHLAGAASAVSLVGDVVKAAIYTRAELIDTTSWIFVLAAIPLMILATRIGRQLNDRMGEQAYAVLFWSVMIGYSVRILMI